MIRDTIKDICKAKGISINRLEKEVGISKGYLHKMTNPSIDLLRKLADKLNVDVCDLISEEKLE